MASLQDNIFEVHVVIYIGVSFKKNCGETFLVIQGLRLQAPSTECPGSVPGRGTRSYIPQLKKGSWATELKILHASGKSRDTECHNQDLMQPNK